MIQPRHNDPNTRNNRAKLSLIDRKLITQYTYTPPKIKIQFLEKLDATIRAMKEREKRDKKVIWPSAHGFGGHVSQHNVKE